MSRHNGRSGKHGVYNPKHNDRSFNIENADNITPSRTSFNLYWDCQNGLRTHVENASGQYPSFVQHEHDEYERRYGAFIAGQNARNKKSGHTKRNRTVDDLLADIRVCPEETIYQIGKEGDCPPPEILIDIVQEFMDTVEERFGKHVHVLDWALHLDETSPHIHARQVFDIENRYGEREPKQEKALEALGIPLPDPAKKPSRTNNRKVTFDHLCRDLLLAICREHGLEVETEAIYGGRASREKNDYIIEAQRDKIAELEKRNAQLTSENTQQAQQLAQKSAELDHKLDSLHHVDTLLETVSETAYNQALSVVADRTIRETQKADKAVITAQMEQVYAQDGFMLPHTRRLILQWLENARKAIELSAKSVVKRVMTALRKPETRAAGVRRIREEARPLIREVLQSYKAQSKETKTRHYGMER